MKLISKVISVLFHPVFFTTMGMAYIIFVSQNEALAVPQGKEMQWFLITLYSTLFMPLLVIFCFGGLSSFNLFK